MMRPQDDIRTLFGIIHECLREVQNSRGYLNVRRNIEYPFAKNSEADVLLSWERITQITLEKLEIHLGLVDYGPDKEEALRVVDQLHPEFKYKES